jgi:hypothetical protein
LSRAAGLCQPKHKERTVLVIVAIVAVFAGYPTLAALALVLFALAEI